MKIRLEHQLNKEKNRLTSAHYDAYPFDFLTPEDEKNIASLQPLPFTRFVNAYLGPDSNVVEIGCGPGRASLYLVSLGISLTAVDISPGSILLAKRRAPQARYLLANNMELPFSDKEFDAVISDGVVHHTADPYQSFCELARILRSDGVMYLGVYRRQRYYFYVYTYLGMPIRWLEKTRVGRGLLNLTLIPLYYLVHLLKSRGKRTWRGARNFFYDYIITPQASFHSKEEIAGWGKNNQLELVDYEEHVGNVHAFVFRKCG